MRIDRVKDIDVKVGNKVYLVKPSKRRYDSEPVITEQVITKVGHTFFTVSGTEDRVGVKFNINTCLQYKIYTPSKAYKLYSDPEIYNNEKRVLLLRELLHKYFGHYSMHNDLSLESLLEIHGIIDKHIEQKWGKDDIRFKQWVEAVDLQDKL